jgi:protein O-GlcNAc transferase
MDIVKPPNARLEPSQPRSAADDLLANGNQFEDRREFEAALDVYRRAVATAPTYARAYLNVGNALRKLDRLDEAATAFRDALQCEPDYFQARFNLGSLLTSRGQFEAAETELREALRLQPDLAEAAVVLADVLESTQRSNEAEAELLRALRLRPDLGGAALNLGHLLLRMNRLEQAETWILRAKDLDPTVARDALSSYCFSLNLRSDLQPSVIFDAHVRIGAAISRAAGPAFTTFPSTREPERRLRLGYVSGDLKQHPVGLFMRPVLKLHDRNKFEVHCYFNSEKPDSATEVLRQSSEYWHQIEGMADVDAANLIRSHQIDVLVDLSGYTDNTRLAVFAQRAAPVQATWLGYLNTTGLQRMDYRICDGHAERDGIADRLHTERLYRLPDSQWCYAPWYEVDPIHVPHSDRPNALIFGSFNQLQKIGDASLDIWCSILRALPEAELLVADVSEERSRRTLLDKFAKRGIAAGRVAIRDRMGILEYFRALGNVDIALDPYPYNGATTTLDTLWMGTPVVALEGDRGVARGGYSILRSLGLSDLIAASTQEYADLNVRLARDGGWRSALRASLRARMEASPLMDITKFVAALEAGYAQMWRNWCSKEV